MTTHVSTNFGKVIANAACNYWPNLCIWYQLHLGEPRQCGIRSLPNTSTHDLCWEPNPRPSDLGSPTPYQLYHMLPYVVSLASRWRHCLTTIGYLGDVTDYLHCVLLQIVQNLDQFLLEFFFCLCPCDTNPIWSKKHGHNNKTIYICNS